MAIWRLLDFVGLKYINCGLNYFNFEFKERLNMKLLFLLVLSVFTFQFLFAQSTEVTIVYTNNTNGNLENCV